jgi:hypothetical protein
VKSVVKSVVLSVERWTSVVKSVVKSVVLSVERWTSVVKSVMKSVVLSVERWTSVVKSVVKSVVLSVERWTSIEWRRCQPTRQRIRRRLFALATALVTGQPDVGTGWGVNEVGTGWGRCSLALGSLALGRLVRRAHGANPQAARAWFGISAVHVALDFRGTAGATSSLDGFELLTLQAQALAPAAWALLAAACDFRTLAVGACMADHAVDEASGFDCRPSGGCTHKQRIHTWRQLHARRK